MKHKETKYVLSNIYTALDIHITVNELYVLMEQNLPSNIERNSKKTPILEYEVRELKIPFEMFFKFVAACEDMLDHLTLYKKVESLETCVEDIYDKNLDYKVLRLIISPKTGVTHTTKIIGIGTETMQGYSEYLYMPESRFREFIKLLKENVSIEVNKELTVISMMREEAADISSVPLT